jgi:hypothetical protein
VTALEAAWAAGRTIVIEGEAGLGKSRLATDFAAAHGPYALARCRSGDAEVPYASFARALRALLGPASALPATLPDWIAPEIARLLPELGAGRGAAAQRRGTQPLLRGCARAWQGLSEDDFDAIVVDDWHLADAASRVLFAFVVRRRQEAGSGGAREILVLRPDLDAAAADALASLLASSRAAHVRLHALSGDEVLELVRQLSGAGEPARFAARLARATGGNPFFLAESLRHLVEAGLVTVDADGAWQTPFDASTEDYREMPVPASVHEAVRVARRTARAGDAARARSRGARRRAVLAAPARAGVRAFRARGGAGDRGGGRRAPAARARERRLRLRPRPGAAVARRRPLGRARAARAPAPRPRRRGRGGARGGDRRASRGERRSGARGRAPPRRGRRGAAARRAARRDRPLAQGARRRADAFAGARAAPAPQQGGARTDRLRGRPRARRRALPTPRQRPARPRRAHRRGDCARPRPRPQAARAPTRSRCSTRFPTS